MIILLFLIRNIIKYGAIHVSIKQNASLADAHETTNGHAVQVTPQKIKIKIRVGKYIRQKRTQTLNITSISCKFVKSIITTVFDHARDWSLVFVFWQTTKEKAKGHIV